MQKSIITMLLTALVVVGAITLPIKQTPDATPQPFSDQATTTPPTPREFLKQEIKRQELTNRDEIILTEIIQCESGWEQFWPNTQEVKVSNGNIGLAQINHGAHETEYEKLGLDPYDPLENLEYAVILYKRGGIRDWQKWSGHCFIPALAKKGIFLNLEKLEGQTGGQCVTFIENLFKDWLEITGAAGKIEPNADQPAAGYIVLTSEGKFGHVAYIYKIENDELILAESNYNNDEKITVGRRLKISSELIRGYYNFNK